MTAEIVQLLALAGSSVMSIVMIRKILTGQLISPHMLDYLREKTRDETEFETLKAEALEELNEYDPEGIT